MTSLTRRLAQLLGSLVLAVLLVSCTERPVAPTASATIGLKPSGPSNGYAPVYGCDNLTPATMCVGSAIIGLPAADTVRIEQLRVCKVYPGGTGPDVQIQLVANYVQFQYGPQSGTYTLHANQCLTLWRNGEEDHGVRSTDIITVTELPVPGYHTTSTVSTIIRDQANPAGPGDPASTFTKTVNAPTTAATVTTNIGGNRVPGALVTFINTLNQPPHAIVNGPYVNVEGSTVTFSSAGTADPEGDPLTYFWTFGDGATSTAQNPTHVYADNGVYPVTVTVDDGSGPITANTTATITNLPPVPTLATSTPNVSCGQTGYVTSTFTDPGVIDNLWSYDINWGDGSAHSTGTTVTQSGTISGSHLYASNGTYTVTITVTDKDGATGTATTTITRNCAPPPPPGPSCTFTQGYWKNHESAWPAPYSPTAQWLNSTHKVNGVTWDGLMGMNVAGGNSYMQLAHQWIAAKLNLGSALSSGNATVDAALSAGGAWLLTNTPASTNSVPNIKNAQATAWASTLDSYNNGLLGTPHCQ